MVLTELDWEDLLYAIKEKKCTPIIGSDTTNPWIDNDHIIAERWAKKFAYPFDDTSQLSKVAQYLAVTDNSDLTPKNILKRELETIKIPDFSLIENKDTPYAVLARLNLPIYLTTNYDNLMESALQNHGKYPISEWCPWNDNLLEKMKEKTDPLTFNKGHGPSEERPSVYHFHGQISDPDSIILTDLDYLSFVTYLGQEIDKIISSVIRIALADSILLFIGYSLDDIKFLVIFQGVIKLIKRLREKKSIAVQLTNIKPKQKTKVEEYFENYTNKNFSIRVYWGSSNQFSKDLGTKWDSFKSTW